LSRVQVDQDDALHGPVGADPPVERGAFVGAGDGNLAGDGQLVLAQVVGERDLVDGLRQPRPEGAVHGDRGVRRRGGAVVVVYRSPRVRERTERRDVAMAFDDLVSIAVDMPVRHAANNTPVQRVLYPW
jgi:hypothetical protein